jgi:hypothetical protein
MQRKTRSVVASRAGLLLRVALLTLVAAVVAGCAATGKRAQTPLPVPVDRASAEGALIASYLDVLMKLAQGSPAQQAEIFSAIKNEHGAAPTPSRVLRYGLALGTPGHAGFDPVGAQRLLREVLASPETLLPAERALAVLELRQIERHQTLVADARRVQSGADRVERERIAQLSRRLTAESEENARLKRALEEAQAKLDAIANIERSSNGSASKPEGRTP